MLFHTYIPFCMQDEVLQTVWLKKTNIFNGYNIRKERKICCSGSNDAIVFHLI